MKITIDGHEVNVTQLKQLLDGLGAEDDLYFSDSAGTFINIRDMHPEHAKNAMLKIYREWVAQLNEFSSTELVEKLRSGPVNSPKFLRLLKHYIKETT